MFALKIALLLVCAAAVQGQEQASCDYSDSEYMTGKSNEHMAMAMAGQDGKWNSSNHLYVAEVEDIGETLSMKLNDVTLSGLGEAYTKSLSLDEKTSLFNWTIRAPQLITTYKFVLEGSFKGIDLTGQGNGTDVRSEYNINLSGTYRSYTDDENKEHVSMEDVLVSFELVGTVTYDLEGLSDDTNEALNNVSRSVDKEVDEDFLKDMMKNIFVKNMNDFLEIYSMQELFCNSS